MLDLAGHAITSPVQIKHVRPWFFVLWIFGSKRGALDGALVSISPVATNVMSMEPFYQHLVTHETAHLSLYENSSWLASASHSLQ